MKHENWILDSGRPLGVLVALTLASLAGCVEQAKKEGGQGSVANGPEAAARAFFDQEFQKWMIGQGTVIQTGPFGAAPPISYEIQSIVPLPASKDEPELIDYQLNVVITFTSKAGTPLEKVANYRLMTNDNGKTWIASETQESSWRNSELLN